jgi:hypothetical protein
MKKYLPLTALLVLAACGDGETETETTEDAALTPVPVEMEPIPADTGTATGAVTAGRIGLTNLDADDRVGLNGELGCTFTLPGRDAPSFVAMAYVDLPEPAEGVIGIGGEAIPVTAEAGNFGEMERQGATFSGGGLTVDVTPQGADGLAVLNLRTEGGAEMTAEGSWVCGS